MKQISCGLAALAALAALLLTTSPAAAEDDSTEQILHALEDQISGAWVRDGGAWMLSDTAAWKLVPPPCARTLGALRARGVPYTLEIEIARDSRDLKRGRHQLWRVRAACDEIARVAMLRELSAQIAAAVDAANEPRPARDADVARAVLGDRVGEPERAFQACIETYEAVIASGLRSTDRLEITGSGVTSQTLGVLVERHCRQPSRVAELARKDHARGLARMLAADKLALASQLDARFALRGGRWTTRPARLAAARVWFTLRPLWELGSCPRFEAAVALWRIEFDVHHRVAKQTATTHCGLPPRSAYR